MRNIPQKNGISKMKHIGKDGKNDPLSEKNNNIVWCMINEATQVYIWQSEIYENMNAIEMKNLVFISGYNYV